MLTKSLVPYSYDLYIGVPISRLLTELREPSLKGPSLHLPCNTWNLFNSLKFSFTKNVAQNKEVTSVFSVYTQL